MVFLIRNVGVGGFGGGEIYQLKLAKELKKAGFVPVIVTNSRELLKRANRLGFKTLVPPYMKNQNWSGWRNALLPIYFGYIWRLKKWYEDIFKYHKPSVINIQSRDDFLAATMAGRKYGIRILWTDHADFRNWVLWNVNVKYKNTIGKEIVKLSRYADKVIFVSKKVKEETEKMIKPIVIHNDIVIENGVIDEKRDYDNIKTIKTSFVFVGRVAEEKGIAELVAAFRIVLKKHVDARLNIYGDGEDMAKYKKVADGNRQIIFHGRTDEPLKAMAENDIFVLPSYREGLSLSLLDAAMMEKKIIASDVDGNSEVVKNGETGLLVPAKNVEKLAEAMIWMLENPEEAEELAKNARKYYERNFNFEKIFAEKMLPLYNIEKE